MLTTPSAQVAAPAAASAPRQVLLVDSAAALEIGGEWTKVSGLRPGQKGLNAVFILLARIGRVVQSAHTSPVQIWLAADETGSVHLALYDQHASPAAYDEGDILRLCGGYCSLYQGHLRLYVGTGGQLRRIGDFTMRYTESPNISSRPWSASTSTPVIKPERKVK